MTKIRVDFNRRAKNGQVIGSARRADGDLAVGDRVQAEQPEDDMAFDAIVAAIDERGRVFLDMLWEPAAVRVAAQVKPVQDWYRMSAHVAQGFTATAPRPSTHHHGFAALSTKKLSNA